jgi:hypothetical protein
VGNSAWSPIDEICDGKKVLSQNLRGMDALAKRERDQPQQYVYLFSWLIHSVSEHEDMRLGA